MWTFFPVCHAGVNAIMNKNSFDVSGCTLYVALFPCNECTKVIIQAGIKTIIYASDTNKDQASILASKKMLDMAGIKYRWVTKFILSFDFALLIQFLAI